MEDQYSSNWYKQGGRPHVIAQWSEHCQGAIVTSLSALAASYEGRGDRAEADEAFAGLLAHIKGTDVAAILRVYRGELDGQPNKLTNGGFESTANVKDDKPVGPGWTSEGAPPGWGTWKIDPLQGKLYLDGGKARGGKLSAALEGGECICYVTTIPVEAGKQYAAWAYGWAEKVSPQRKTTLEVRWQDEAGKWFNGGLNTAAAVAQPGRWERVVSVVKAPEGATRAVVLLVVYEMPQREKAWFDDVAFVEVP